MKRFAVVAFPGSNCMQETAAALQAAGAAVDIVRWNAPRHWVERFDGYVVAGGFAYEDRVRAGAIAAKHDILEVIAAAAAAGKPVLGVCNGAQVLIESGLVPALQPGRVEVALAPNAAVGWSGYYCDWVHVQLAPTRGFLAALPATPIPMPVGHGEGRFTGDAAVFAALERGGQIPLRYVSADGAAAPPFPENPNGSLQAAAAVSNGAGNVVALMPHPERAAWLYQVPETLPGAWGERRRCATGTALLGPGPGLELYVHMVRAAGS